ncbi:vWA domain-containing protein [Deinococcus ruber]|uniref:VWFA domain-containing protein n=1 Tax=Deinococcus ruber TaxID=1848197 RepID=A0A918CA23_9DEIO|nr:vWA domain-containing protein [Deinococcus ruber]GGR13219.1 hypothetical protein GCM10008957_27720 [Deinococcus ruber]
MTTPARWWQDASIRTWAWQAWRCYAWRPGYRLTLTTSERTAYVDMKNKIVVCNPEYPYPPLQSVQQVRHLPKDVREFQMQYLESLIAHEAGHTHHSGPLPAGLLGQLVNIIEDHRMERLMARDFPNLAALFELACDADAAHCITSDGQGGDVIRGCLLHRFTATHPTWAYVPDRADAHHWLAVKVLLEAAWDAPTYGDVVATAAQILALLGRENAPADPQLQPFLDGLGQAVLPSDANSSEIGEEADDGSSATPKLPGPGGAGAARIPPERPQADPQESTDCTLLKSELEGEIRRLAAVLAQPGKPDRTLASRDRGRYRSDREATGSERPFDLRVGAEKAGPTHLRLAVDVSSSMRGDRLDQARRLSFTVTAAAQRCNLPMVAVAFDDAVHPLFDPQTRPTAALNAVAALHTLNNTSLAPALRAIWQPVLPGKSLTFILTDGELDGSDYAACQRLRAKHTGVVVPVLLEQDDDVRQQYEATFGVCVALSDASLLVPHIVSFLRGRFKH